VVSLKDRHRKTILGHAGMSPMYLPSGHLAYVTKGELMAVPFDPERLELRGEAKPVIEDVVEDATYGSIQFSFSQTGPSFTAQAGPNVFARCCGSAETARHSHCGRSQPWLWSLVSRRTGGASRCLSPMDRVRICGSMT